MRETAPLKAPSGHLEDYEAVVGKAEIDELRRLAEPLRGYRVQMINSTRLGGGVAELLACKVPLMQELGLKVSWDVLTGSPEFFEVTKRAHNALHGVPVRLDREDWRIFREITDKNRDLIRPDTELVIIHDPQPAGLVEFRTRGKVNWIWRCHIDISDADVSTWSSLRRFVERYDAAVFHLSQYTKDLMIPQYLVPPAIDPLSAKNEEIPADRAREIVAGLGIDPELPIVLQVSRFDYLKDPFGVLDAFRMASGWEPAQLVLAGGSADDDPEGAEVYAKLQERAEGMDNVHLLSLPPDSHEEINALQRTARVVVQKSIREGFGLVVTEAMWKGKPVVGNAVGGIRAQVLDGISGFLVHSTEGMAFRIRQLLTDPERSARMGRRAKESVRAHYLIPSSIRRWLAMFHTVRAGSDGISYLGTPVSRRSGT